MPPTDPQQSLVRWRRGVVLEQTGRWRGAQELRVRIEGRFGEPPGEARALAYPALVGSAEPGDEVLLNTTALAMGLGTGGYALVIANLTRLPDDPTGPGHIVKLRYSPLQATVLSVDEQDSPHHDAIAHSTGLRGMPVVVADLHSAVPAILAGIRADHPDLRVAYVWSDGASTPAWLSRSLAQLASLLAGTITVGQAVGGDLEAVTLHNGLLAAREVLDADVAIVAQGPGNAGTGTPWGFSGVASGDAVNAAHVLGGCAIGALRISDADHRGRHVGVSHHSLTAFAKVALAPVELGLPGSLPDALADAVRRDLDGLPERVRVTPVRTEGLDAALRALPVRLSTMGRGLDEDYWYFIACAAAGRLAASRARG